MPVPSLQRESIDSLTDIDQLSVVSYKQETLLFLSMHIAIDIDYFFKKESIITHNSWSTTDLCIEHMWALSVEMEPYIGCMFLCNSSLKL